MGRIYTYEFHEARAKTAAWVPHHPLPLTHAHPALIHSFSDEFTRHGLSDIVTLTHRNVCKDGFSVTDIADAGALFLFTVVLEDLAHQPLPI